MREKGAYTGDILGEYMRRVRAVAWLFTGYSLAEYICDCACALTTMTMATRAERWPRRRVIATRASDGHKGENTVRFESMKCMYCCMCCEFMGGAMLVQNVGMQVVVARCAHVGIAGKSSRECGRRVQRVVGALPIEKNHKPLQC